MSTRKPQRLLDNTDAATLLGLKPRQLERMRGRGRGPQWTYVGRYPRYSLASINAYLSARAQGSVTRG